MKELIETKRVLSTAAELRNLNEQLKGKLQSLEEVEGRLVSKYEGNSRDSFHTTFQKDMNRMREFSKTIDEYAAVLQQNAEAWIRADNEAAGIAQGG